MTFTRSGGQVVRWSGGQVASPQAACPMPAGDLAAARRRTSYESLTPFPALGAGQERFIKHLSACDSDVGTLSSLRQETEKCGAEPTVVGSTTGGVL